MNHLQQLRDILRATGWPQEQLARELDVSFPALNAWLNQRAQPRQNALRNIERLYLNIVGAETVDETQLGETAAAALQLRLTAEELSKNKTALDTLILHLTYHTNTIEGSTMTLSDVEDVIFDHKVLSNRTAVEQAEARNHQAALLWALDQLVIRGDRFAIDENFILNIHLRLMNGIMSDAGQYRKHSVRIMGTHVVLANWMKVPDLMQRFTQELQVAPKDTIATLAKTHAAFEQIHPFSDGNGRTGRLILLTQALQASLTPPLTPKERKHAYYKYLEAAQVKGDIQPLTLFMAQSIIACREILREQT